MRHPAAQIDAWELAHAMGNAGLEKHPVATFAIVQLHLGLGSALLSLIFYHRKGEMPRNINLLFILPVAVIPN